MSVCAFCGHPDSRHRVVDTIEERIAAGEHVDDVLADYGWDWAEFVQVREEVWAVGEML